MTPFKKHFEDTSTASVVGTGDDSSTVIFRRKYDRDNKRKDIVASLDRYKKLLSRDK